MKKEQLKKQKNKIDVFGNFLSSELKKFRDKNIQLVDMTSNDLEDICTKMSNMKDEMLNYYSMHQRYMNKRLAEAIKEEKEVRDQDPNFAKLHQGVNLGGNK